MGYRKVLPDMDLVSVAVWKVDIAEEVLVIAVIELLAT